MYNPNAEIGKSVTQEGGAEKQITTDITLYRDGTLVCDVFTRNNNWFGCLRGHVLVVVYDEDRRAIWVSQEMVCATRCSIPDPSCASWGRETFTQKAPQAVGTY